MPPIPARPEAGSLADPDDCPCTDCDGSCLVGDYDLDPDGGDGDDEPVATTDETNPDQTTDTSEPGDDEDDPVTTNPTRR